MISTVPDRSLDNLARELHALLEKKFPSALAGVGVGARGDGPELIVYAFKSAKIRPAEVPTDYLGVPVRLVRTAPFRL